MNRVSVLLQGLIGWPALLFFAGHVAGSQQTLLTVTSTGYEVFEPVFSMAWIDNSQLLFWGSKSISVDSRRASPAPKRFYIWNGVTNTASFYADSSTAFCYAMGKLYYTVRVDKQIGKRVLRIGPLGSEQEIESPLPSRKEVYSKFTCRTHRLEDLTPPALGRRVIILREGDGYIDLGPISPPADLNSNDNLSLFNTKNESGVRLPITRDEDIASHDVFHSAYRDAYVLRPKRARNGSARNWPSGTPLVVYLLWKDGRAQRTSIPYFPSEYLYSPQAIRTGWIYGGGNFYKTAGLYLFDGKSTKKIDSGSVRAVEVSADGCAAAVAINNLHLEMGSPVRIKIFRFCK